MAERQEVTSCFVPACNLTTQHKHHVHPYSGEYHKQAALDRSAKKSLQT